MTHYERLLSTLVDSGIEQFMLSKRVKGNVLEVLAPAHLRPTFQLTDQIHLHEALQVLVDKGKILKRKDIYRVR